MGKLLSAALAGIVGLGLSGLAAWGIVSANTAAPNKNPADKQVVDYGNR